MSQKRVIKKKKEEKIMEDLHNHEIFESPGRINSLVNPSYITSEGGGSSKN